MLRPPRLLSIIAASCLTLLAHSASAQPAWDLDDDDGSNASSSSASESGSASASTSASSDDVTDSSSAAPAYVPAPASSASFDAEVEVDRKLAQVGDALKDLQPRVRAYSAGWMVAQAGLIGFSTYMAVTQDGAQRSAGIVRATVSGLNLLRMFVTPMPMRGGYRKFKKLPDGTLAEKRAKIDAGRQYIGAQLAADREATKPAAHVLVGLVALGCGAGLLFRYEETGMRPAVETMLGILLVGELQLLTRPFRTRRYNRELAGALAPRETQISLAPFMTRDSRGLGLVGRF